jgi:hypothetical protein
MAKLRLKLIYHGGMRNNYYWCGEAMPDTGWRIERF